MRKATVMFLTFPRNVLKKSFESYPCETYLKVFEKLKQNLKLKQISKTLNEI